MSHTRAVFGFDNVPGFRGRCIFPHFACENGQKYPFTYATTRRGNWVCIRSNDRKYLRHTGGSEEFYDLSHDPGETLNLAPFQPNEMIELRDIYLEFISETGRGLETTEDPVNSIPQHLRKELRALGYLN